MAYPNLEAEMRRSGIEPKDLCPLIDRNADTVRNRLKGIGDFSIQQAFSIQGAFFPDLPLPYLFSKEPTPLIVVGNASAEETT